MKILLATGNSGKLDEFRKLLDIPGLSIIGLKDLESEYPDCVEDGKTFEENADKKMIHWQGLTFMNVLADDSGLTVDALNGAPGVRSARFAGEKATDKDNNELLIERMKGVNNRAARFVCCLSLGLVGGNLFHFSGSVEGRILENPRGDKGFGYDPLFYHEESGLTFAELAAESKNLISHRAIAANKLRGFLLEEKLVLKD